MRPGYQDLLIFRSIKAVYYEVPTELDDVPTDETADLILVGEELDDSDDNDLRPIRTLTNFCIFDPKHGDELVSLAAMEEADGLDRHFSGAGFVGRCLDGEDKNDEDEGQEDEEPAVYVHLSSILRVSFDMYLKDE